MLYEWQSNFSHKTYTVPSYDKHCSFISGHTKKILKILFVLLENKQHYSEINQKMYISLYTCKLKLFNTLNIIGSYCDIGKVCNAMQRNLFSYNQEKHYNQIKLLYIYIIKGSLL